MFTSGINFLELGFIAGTHTGQEGFYWENGKSDEGFKHDARRRVGKWTETREEKQDFGQNKKFGRHFATTIVRGPTYIH